MQNKLQELTDKLYNEGLSKGKQEAEEMVASAKAKADQIIAKAKGEAEQIIASSEKDAEELRSKVNNDIKLASTQTISFVKQQVENAVITKVINDPVKSALSDVEFVKSMITKVVSAFDAANPQSKGLDVILPADAQSELFDFVKNQIGKSLKGGIEVKSVKGMANGFKIAPKDSGYQISFTESEFSNMFGEFVRPATKKILFEE